MGRPILIVRATQRAHVERALEAGFRRFLLEGPLDGAGRIDALVRDGEDLTKEGRRVGKYVRIRGAQDEHRIRALKGKVDVVVADPTDWKVIPLENLVAALGGRPKLYAVAASVREARLFLGTLERGVDGVVIAPTSREELHAYRRLLEPPREPARLVAATVTRIEPVGLGERVCVDTARIFRKGEGLLVGSTAAAFFLVAAECEESPYVAARPFRVNAGAVHAYLWNGETTRYLSELRSGLEVEAVDARGRRRSVTVGRAKIETRPLLLVEARFRGGRASVLLQNAETIRLVGPKGATISVSNLRAGQRVLVHPEGGARHFGMKVKESLQEL